MQLGIVRPSVLEHPEENFEQSLSQAPQGTRMTHAPVTFLLVISLAPGAGFAERIGPQMNRVAQEFVAGLADTHSADLARLIGYRRGPGDSLQHFLSAVALWVIAHRPEQAWS